MIIEVPYGEKKKKIKIDKKRVLEILEPPRLIIGDEIEKVRKAVLETGKPRTKAWCEGKDILILVEDWTRPTPTYKALEAIYPWIKSKRVKILVATGAHHLGDKHNQWQNSPSDRQKLEFIFNRFLEIFKNQIYIHDAKKDDEMVYFGKTRRGTEVYLNKLIKEASHLLIIGSITPHWFAGFTGGRKIFLPGVSSFKTITQNHLYAARPESQLFDLDNNPVHQDMMEVLEFLEDKQIFSIQLVLWGKKIYQCFAGALRESFLKGVEVARKIFSAEIFEKADIVVSVNSPPYDLNLYQSQKTLESGKRALKEGGILILVSPCREGIGDEKFFNLLAEHKTPEKALKEIAGQFGCHKASKIAQLAQWAEIWAVTDLPPDVLKKVFMKPFDNLQEAVEKALKKKGPESKILFIMDGNTVIPVYKNQK